MDDLGVVMLPGCKNANLSCFASLAGMKSGKVHQTNKRGIKEQRNQSISCSPSPEYNLTSSFRI